MKIKNKKILLGAAFAGIMMASSIAHAQDASGKPATDGSGTEMMGECHGVNSCKGMGACGGEGHDCSGKNECKGKGWMKMTKADCEAKSGTFKEKK